MFIYKNDVNVLHMSNLYFNFGYFLRFYFSLLADLKVTKIITVIYYIVLSKNKLSLETENSQN